MYCANCGVKLADTEKCCPLCGVTAYHPEIKRNTVEPLYASEHHSTYQMNSKAAHIVMSIAFLLALSIIFLIDLQINAQITWSGFVGGAIILTYIFLVLPTWFTKPNPVVFVPCDFVAAGLYVLYISLATDGHWFLSFAFPTIAFFGIVATTVTALLRYIRRGKLYIFGGASIATGLFMPVIELLIYITFNKSAFVVWSIYPALALTALGGILIFLAINHHAREAMEKKLFI